MKAAILALLLSFPMPWYRHHAPPETKEEYQARLEVIAEALDLELSGLDPYLKLELAAGTSVKIQGESALKLEVHDGRKRGDWGKSICLGQQKQLWGMTKDEWESLAGTSLEATRRCIRGVVRLLHAAILDPACIKTTKGSERWARAFTRYAYGSRDCTPGRREISRSYSWSVAMNKLTVELAKQPKTALFSERSKGLSSLTPDPR